MPDLIAPYQLRSGYGKNEFNFKQIQGVKIMNKQNTYKQIVDMMHNANEHIQYPRIKLRDGYNLQMAGANSRHPKSINITDGKPFGSSKWFGRIETNGNLQLATKFLLTTGADDLKLQLALFQSDPVKYAKGYGDIHSNCMFCRRELSNPQSIAVGYGPTCAENYGLPWGDIDPKLAKAQANLEFDLPSGKEDSPTTATESRATVLLNEVATIMLSRQKQAWLQEEIERNPADEYMLLITALWEGL